jgi:hypothetical protein
MQRALWLMICALGVGSILHAQQSVDGYVPDMESPGEGARSFDLLNLPAQVGDCPCWGRAPDRFDLDLLWMSQLIIRHELHIIWGESSEYSTFLHHSADPP